MQCDVTRVFLQNNATNRTDLAPSLGHEKPQAMLSRARYVHVCKKTKRFSFLRDDEFYNNPCDYFYK